jgi:hypothetical protein
VNTVPRSHSQSDEIPRQIAEVPPHAVLPDVRRQRRPVPLLKGVSFGCDCWLVQQCFLAA